jgi:hypothetical protein
MEESNYRVNGYKIRLGKEKSVHILERRKWIYIYKVVYGPESKSEKWIITNNEDINKSNIQVVNNKLDEAIKEYFNMQWHSLFTIHADPNCQNKIGNIPGLKKTQQILLKKI